MSDHQEKTPRSFYIKNYLCIVFEEMAQEIGCSIDYLVNEAMRTYARTHRPSRALDTPTAQRDFSADTLDRRSSLSSQFLTPHPNLPPIYLWFNEHRYVIQQPKFMIGRGGSNQEVDLIISDHNISRRHCAITYSNGEYIIKDLNSTNGIVFDEQRIPHKSIKEGDSFFLCDYKISFTFDSNKVF